MITAYITLPFICFGYIMCELTKNCSLYLPQLTFSVNSYTELGCFNDNAAHPSLPERMVHLEQNDTKKIMTVDLCTNECFQKNYTYAGVQVNIKSL